MKTQENYGKRQDKSRSRFKMWAHTPYGENMQMCDVYYVRTGTRHPVRRAHANVY